MSGEQTWKSLVYNVDITQDQVKNFYKGWAESYEDDMNRLNFTGSNLKTKKTQTFLLEERDRKSLKDISRRHSSCGYSCRCSSEKRPN